MACQTFRNPLNEDQLSVEKLLQLGPVQPRNVDRKGIGAEPGGMGGIDPTHFFPHKYSYPPHFINVTTHKFSYSKNFSFTEFKKRRQISNMYYVNIILLICFSDSCHRSSRSVNGELIPVYLVNFYFLVHPSYI